MVQKFCFLHMTKTKLFAKNFSTNSSFDDTCMTNLKLHNFLKTSRLVKRVITNLDLPKSSGLDCCQAILQKNCKPELSYLLNYSICVWRNFVFQIVGRSHFKIVEKRCMAKNYNLASLLSVVKSLEKTCNW